MQSQTEEMQAIAFYHKTCRLTVQACNLISNIVVAEEGLVSMRLDMDVGLWLVMTVMEFGVKL
jgi:hypothetical protein